MSSQILALHATRGIEYDLLLRDLARTEPRYGFTASDIQLSREQTAIVIREFPDVVTEAIAGSESDIAICIEQTLIAAAGALVVRLVSERCTAYIVGDLQEMCEQVEEEESTRERECFA